MMMVYYQSPDLTVRDLRLEDAAIFTAEEIMQGWHATEDKLLTRLRDAEGGRCVALTAERLGRPAGYVSVYFDPHAGAFAHQGIPEIVDFAVLEKYRRQGVGNALMDAAERIAGERRDTVCLGVGLHSGYGAVQRMYVKRGYVPDGSGAWYRDSVCEPYAACRNDDDLVLYMSKRLRG